LVLLLAFPVVAQDSRGKDPTVQASAAPQIATPKDGNRSRLSVKRAPDKTAARGRTKSEKIREKSENKNKGQRPAAIDENPEKAAPAENPYAGTLSVPVSDVMFKAYPPPGVAPESSDPAPDQSRTPKTPAVMDKGQMEAMLAPGDHLNSVGRFRPGPDERLNYVEIEVSHSRHWLRLLAHNAGNTDVLHQCGVGLGASGFPTPVGQYYVTHIYDETPWWIPPPDRSWAAGQSPSKKVYGGTMAPLLKKRPVRTRAKAAPQDDMIEAQVTLQDDGYRFHGTNAPRSIGRNESHGCVRMIPDDAKKVASLIKDQVGIADRKASENGTFVILKSPVRLNIIK